jgi:hypothetical protein
MAVEAVSSSGNAAASAQVRARQPEQNDQPQSARKAESDRAQAEREAAERARAEAEKNNKPSVNTSGQTVGQRVNTSA